ncbi:hypothetical protein Tco_0214214 [Tanacetum coccineum]
MSQPANDDFSQHLSDDEASYHEDASDNGTKVIQNGNSKKRISTGKDGVVRILSPVYVVEIHVVEKERKARTILLMAIPKEHAVILVLKTQDDGWIWQCNMLNKPISNFLRPCKVVAQGRTLRRFPTEITHKQGTHNYLKSSASAQNVAFVSHSKSSTNKVKSGHTGAYSTYTPSTSSKNIPEREVLLVFAG